MATENGPCEGVSPIKSGGFQLPCWFTRGYCTALEKEGSMFPSFFEIPNFPGVDVEKFRECTTCILAAEKNRS